MSGKNLIGLILLIASAAALGWLGYHVMLNEMPDLSDYREHPEKLMKWAWLLGFAMLGGAYLLLQKKSSSA